MAWWWEKWKPPLSAAVPTPSCWLCHPSPQRGRNSCLHCHAFKRIREQHQSTFPFPSSPKILFFFLKPGLIHHWHKTNQVPCISPEVKLHSLASASIPALQTQHVLRPWVGDTQVRATLKLSSREWPTKPMCWGGHRLGSGGLQQPARGHSPSASHRAATECASSSSHLPTKCNHLNYLSDCINSP